MPETTPLIKAALNLRVGAGFDVYLWASHRAGIYRQRTEENVLKVQLVNFHRLTKS